MRKKVIRSLGMKKEGRKKRKEQKDLLGCGYKCMDKLNFTINKFTTITYSWTSK